MLYHEYSLEQDHGIAEGDYLDETLIALTSHDRAYTNDPLNYFEQLDKAQHHSQTDGRPYLLFQGPEDSKTDFVFAQLPFANRLHPVNSGAQLAEYATGDYSELPRGIKPNSANQAIKHHLAFTAIAGVPEAKDAQGRPPSLVVITSPSADFHQPPLTKSRRKQMRHGDLEIYANPIADIAEQLDAENLHISGFSFGAAVAARAARIRRNFDVRSLTIGEPTTFKARNILKVMGDYTVLDAFNKSSGDPELKKLPNTGWLQDGPQAMQDLDRNGNGGWLDNLYANGNLRTNLQIARALGIDRLRSDLQAAIPANQALLPLTLMYAEDSLMTKGITAPGEDSDTLEHIQSMGYQQEQAKKFQLLRVKPLGEVAAKHIVGEIPMLYADYLARGVKHGYINQ